MADELNFYMKGEIYQLFFSVFSCLNNILTKKWSYDCRVYTVALCKHINLLHKDIANEAYVFPSKKPV